MGRKYVDCREYPNDAKCSLYISGQEEEVLVAAGQHAAAVHGEKDTPEFRAELRKMLKDEPAARAA